MPPLLIRKSEVRKRRKFLLDNPAKITYIISATGGGGNGLRSGIASSAEPGSV
jgi:hypothetical protein